VTRAADLLLPLLLERMQLEAEEPLSLLLERQQHRRQQQPPPQQQQQPMDRLLAMVRGQQHAGRVAECERAERVMSLLGDSLLPPEQQSFDNMAGAADAAGVERWRHRNVVYVKRGARGPPAQ
jgi:hypothetical protein